MPKRYFLNTFVSENVNNKHFNSGFWKPKIQEFIELIRSNRPPIPENADGGLYTGTPGIAYLFYHASTSQSFDAVKKDLIAKGVEYCITAEMYFSKQLKTCPTDNYGFVCCVGGVNAVSAVLHFVAGKIGTSDKYLQKLASSVNYCDAKFSMSFGCNELFVGRAGYLLGLLWIKKTINKTVISNEKINSICKCIIDEGRQQAFSRSPLWYTYYDTGYFGAAHGISGILFVLLSFNNFLVAYPDAEKDIKAAVDYLLSLQTTDGNFPCADDDIQYRIDKSEHELLHWCHGAPGVIYMMAKAYLRWKEEKYLNSCIKSADLVWQRGLLKKGPGLCHGVAGNGYVFLVMYRLTNDQKYLQRAIVFAEFMMTPEFRKNARTPDSPYSLFEGLAGAICYLIDLLNPSQATFPFMDVFYSYD